VQELADLSDSYFSALHEGFLKSGRPFRLRKAEWHGNPLNLPLRDLIHGLAKCESRLDEGAQRDELEGVRQQLQAYREGINEAHTLGNPESVYWLESSGRNQDRVHIRSAPLDVAVCLRERLFNRDTGLLLTSATLAEGPRMESFKAKVGGPDADSEQVASPFDYPLQMQIVVHTGAPGPSSEDGRLDTAFLVREIIRFAREMDGGSLVLFTSYRDLNAVGRQIEPVFRKEGRSVLCQGAGRGRSELLKEFREAGNAVLLGTDSFWTGIDVPGSALSQVIITRLPFENPSHPLAEARAERCRELGQSPFTELTLPAALIKFRQGLGRLIRKQSDEGRLVILDSRIISKPYGSLFLDVLPHDHIERVS